MSVVIKDIVERTVATYLEVFIGLLLAGWGTSISIDTVQAAAIAAVPAALAVVKGIIASRFGGVGASLDCSLSTRDQ